MHRRRLSLLLVAVAFAKAKRGVGTTMTHRPPRSGRRAFAIARGLLGEPYHYGGTSSASGFACSGLVYFVYSRLGFRLPRSSFDQVYVGLWLSEARLHESLSDPR